jgi:dihydroxyacetone kinase-like predicted kinase
VLATRDQLPELRRAGVVDAGGRALCLLLDALVGVLTGEPARPVLLDPLPACRTTPARSQYEVQYVLRTDRIEDLRARLDALGDSVVTAPLGGGEWAVHVHAQDAGAAIEASFEDGRPRRIRIEVLPAVGRSRSLIVVAPGPVVGPLLVAEDVVVLPDDEPGAIRVAAAATPSVVLLAAGKPARVYEAAGALRQAGTEVAVVPLRSPMQALSAVAVHDPGLEFADAVVAMAEAAAATRWGEVRRADQEAQTSAGRCRPGDVLGLAEDDVVLIGTNPDTVAATLLDKMLASSGELVTLVGGTLVEVARRHLADAHQTVEVQAHLGSGPGLLIGVE